MYIITNVPTVMPSFFEKITARTSIPSIAPPKRTARPLPTPEITPPNSEHSTRSFSASGEARDTSIGSTSVMSHEKNE